MSKLHRSALGKMVDMAALQAKNEKVRAVGNMNVNARGDTIDSNDQVIQDNTKRVNVMYQKMMSNHSAKARPQTEVRSVQPLEDVEPPPTQPDPQPAPQPPVIAQSKKDDLPEELPGFDAEFEQPNPKKK